jgi:Prephenate dehydratase
MAYLTDDHPGALLEFLTEFAVRGVNLTLIQSRPTGDGFGRYRFWIDCEGHVEDARVGEALMGLRRVCSDIRLPGQLPTRRRGPPGDPPRHPRRRLRGGVRVAFGHPFRP